jgi:hypothetical protein
MGRPRFFVRVYLHFPLWGYHYPKCERAVRLVYPPFFCTLRSSSNPTKKKTNGMRPVDWNSSLHNHWQSDTCLYDFFSCNDRCYRLPNYWPFLVHHPVYQELRLSTWSKLQIYYKNILLSIICPVAGIFNTLNCLPAFLFVLDLSKSITTSFPFQQLHAYSPCLNTIELTYGAQLTTEPCQCIFTLERVNGFLRNFYASWN